MTTDLDLNAHPIAPLLRGIVACYDRMNGSLPPAHWFESVEKWMTNMRAEQNETPAPTFAGVDFERIARWALAGATACEGKEAERKAKQ